MTNLIVPDKIAPELGWRVWRADAKHGYLSAVHTASPDWLPGRPYEAECRIDRPEPRAWIPVSVEEAVESGETTHLDYLRKRQVKKDKPAPPRTRLPESMRYVWRVVEDTHIAPEPSCKCGIYATRRVEDCADQLAYGTVIGKVALWGKIVPGDKGYRAQTAYPVELFVIPGEERYKRAQGNGYTFYFSSFLSAAPQEVLDAPAALKLAGKVVDQYGVPCTVIDDWQELRA